MGVKKLCRILGQSESGVEKSLFLKISKKPTSKKAFQRMSYCVYILKT